MEWQVIPQRLRGCYAQNNRRRISTRFVPLCLSFGNMRIRNLPLHSSCCPHRGVPHIEVTAALQICSGCATTYCPAVVCEPCNGSRIAGPFGQIITHPRIHAFMQIPLFRFYTLWNWIILATYFGLAAHESWKLMRLSAGQPPKVGRIGQACVVLFHICITVRLSSRCLLLCRTLHNAN